MRRAFLLFLILGLPAAARARLMPAPPEVLVQQSDVIVVGTLRDVSRHTADGMEYGQGHLLVSEVIWGRVSPGDSLLVKWDNPSDIVCSRVRHQNNAGKPGIWLLTFEGESFGADQSGRFVELAGRREVEAALALSPVVLRSADYWVEDGEPMNFSVVYRNVSDVPREFPGVAFEGGRLRLAPGSRLSVKHSPDGDSRVAWKPLASVSDRRLAPVTVGPRGERRVEFDLRELLAAAPKDGEYYDVTLKLAGQRGTNEVSFHLGRPLFPRPDALAPAVDYHRTFSAPAAPAAPRGLPPLVRAGLAALFAFALFPFFRRLRAALVGARLARVTQGAQTWQI